MNPKKWCIKPGKNHCRKRGELELIGLILFVIGAVTLCAFLFPPRIWLILLGAALVVLGYKIFQS